MKSFKGRSDVATEALSELSRGSVGIEKEEFAKDGIKVTRVKITDENAAFRLGKEKGGYVTVDVGNAYEDDSVFFDAVNVLGEELKRVICGAVGKKEFSALVVGLGNVSLTSDAIGPNTAEGIVVTRHMKSGAPELFEKMNFNSVSAVVPGVLGNTGIESSVSVKAVAEKTAPDVVIAIDALASSAPERLCRSVQISDTGISPGSGVGNSRKELSEKTVGVPVVAVGVPTVSDALTVTGSVMAELIKSLENSSNATDLELCDRLTSAWNESSFLTVKRKLSETPFNFIVTPKDIDVLVKKASKLLSLALNKALHNGISQEDVNALLNR